jgi:hypothetical protein
MTKAELIEDVSRAVEMSRKDSEIIVETIFESIVSRASGAIPKPARAWTSLPRKSPISSPARN